MCIFSGRFKHKNSLRPLEGVLVLDAKSFGTFFTFVGKYKEVGSGEGGWSDGHKRRQPRLGKARAGSPQPAALPAVFPPAKPNAPSAPRVSFSHTKSL